MIGAPYLASGVATTASNLLARNVADVLVHFVRNGSLSMDPDDEIDQALVVAAAPRSGSAAGADEAGSDTAETPAAAEAKGQDA